MGEGVGGGCGGLGGGSAGWGGVRGVMGGTGLKRETKPLRHSGAPLAPPGMLMQV